MALEEVWAAGKHCGNIPEVPCSVILVSVVHVENDTVVEGFQIADMLYVQLRPHTFDLDMEAAYHITEPVSDNLFQIIPHPALLCRLRHIVEYFDGIAEESISVVCAKNYYTALGQQFP